MSFLSKFLLLPHLLPSERYIPPLSILFCRFTVFLSSSEPIWIRLIFSMILTMITWDGRLPYDVIMICHGLSHIVSSIGLSQFSYKRSKTLSLPSKVIYFQMFSMIVSIILMALRLIYDISLMVIISHVVSYIPPLPSIITRGIYHLFPIEEMARAYDTVTSFFDNEDSVNLTQNMCDLLFVTFNVQVGMGYLGIGFLRREQRRKNSLVRMDSVENGNEDEAVVGNVQSHEEEHVVNGHDAMIRNGNSTSEQANPQSSHKALKLRKARRFRNESVWFIFCSVVPYMLQMIVVGNMNQYYFFLFRDKLHRHIRLDGLFANDSHLTAMAKESTMAPGDYAKSMDEVVKTCYDIIDRKLFSLPKLMLVPSIISQQPLLLVKIVPFIFLADFLKGRLVSLINTEIQSIDKEQSDLETKRTKMEQFDVKNAHLLQRSSSSESSSSSYYTLTQWQSLTTRIQSLSILSSLLKRTRGYFRWLQRNFVIMALVDCALAHLIAMGRMNSADIFVFSRAFEDVVDFVLMRTRAESELVSMAVEMEKLDKLREIYGRYDHSQGVKGRALMDCRVNKDGAESGVYMNGLLYERGTARVQIDNLQLPPNVYAVTGANGSGKSTLFQILMSCNTNKKPIDLPESIIFPSTSQTTTSKTSSIEISPSGHQITTTNDISGSAATANIIMPSSNVVEISQNFYWPLYSRPIDWIYQKRLNQTEDEHFVVKVVDELMSLRFANDPTTSFSSSSSSVVTNVANNGQNETNSTEMLESSSLLTQESSVSSTTEESQEDVDDDDDDDAARQRLKKELLEEKEDWFADLSGGQKSKVELVRKVFLSPTCPDVLLIDETLAPLDPTSKNLVMTKVKLFCKNSVVMIIYHGDVVNDKDNTDENDTTATKGNDDTNADLDRETTSSVANKDCVPGNNGLSFFDENIHLENGILRRRDFC